MHDMHESPLVERKELAEEEKPAYTPPVVRVMDKDEVLRTFQVTSAGISWWVS